MWTLPASRIKAGREHRVPLQPQAVALLAKPWKTEELAFPSPVKAGKPLSDAALAAVAERMRYDKITAHGFRSIFRDWAGETTSHAREVIEAALALDRGRVDPVTLRDRQTTRRTTPTTGSR